MTFIIAEVGSNWTNFEDASNSISIAKQCGADAVKFQMYTPKEMYGNIPQVEAMKCLNISSWLPKLKEKADACGIEFMCTAFSPEGLREVDKYVSRHKIASSDLSYPGLLLAAKATGKQVLLSTGASSLSDIQLALNVLDKAAVSLLYCVSSYPAKNVNLFAIDHLKKYFSRWDVGYSCHTTDWYTSVAAVKYHGATVIEKHFKIRDMDTPDNGHSLAPKEFKMMVQAIRGERDHVVFPDPSERDMLLRYNRRLIVTTEVKSGNEFRYGENFGCYRSLVDDTEGLSGFLCDRVNGKIAIKAHTPGGPITSGSFK